MTAGISAPKTIVCDREGRGGDERKGKEKNRKERTERKQKVLIFLLVLTAAKAANIEEIFKPIVSWLLSAIKVLISLFPSLSSLILIG